MKSIAKHNLINCCSTQSLLKIIFNIWLDGELMSLMVLLKKEN